MMQVLTGCIRAALSVDFIGHNNARLCRLRRWTGVVFWNGLALSWPRETRMMKEKKGRTRNLTKSETDGILWLRASAVIIIFWGTNPEMLHLIKNVAAEFSCAQVTKTFEAISGATSVNRCGAFKPGQMLLQS